MPVPFFPWFLWVNERYVLSKSWVIVSSHLTISHHTGDDIRETQLYSIRTRSSWWWWSWSWSWSWPSSWSSWWSWSWSWDTWMMMIMVNSLWLFRWDRDLWIDPNRSTWPWNHLLHDLNTIFPGKSPSASTLFTIRSRDRKFPGKGWIPRKRWTDRDPVYNGWILIRAPVCDLPLHWCDRRTDKDLWMSDLFVWRMTSPDFPKTSFLSKPWPVMTMRAKLFLDPISVARMWMNPEPFGLFVFLCWNEQNEWIESTKDETLYLREQ